MTMRRNSSHSYSAMILAVKHKRAVPSGYPIGSLFKHLTGIFSIARPTCRQEFSSRSAWNASMRILSGVGSTSALTGCVLQSRFAAHISLPCGLALAKAGHHSRATTAPPAQGSLSALIKLFGTHGRSIRKAGTSYLDCPYSSKASRMHWQVSEHRIRSSPPLRTRNSLRLSPILLGHSY